MCGIAGALSVRADGDLRASVAAIVEAQRARGPDASAVRSYCTDGARAVLGHSRLSIIDLSREADQPMSDASGRWSLVYNGEIYNYRELRLELEARGARFTTASDTEVLLEAWKAWGVEALGRLFGMFAFAVHDRQSGALWLVRDRFGVKPLYWWSDGKILVFASTPGPVAAWAGLPPNLDYVARGLRLKVYEDETDVSPFAELKALPPGTWMKAMPGSDSLGFASGRYYDLEEAVAVETDAQAALSDEALRERVIARLEDACALRLRSDVPVGLSLSGGLDSSTVAALTARQHPDMIGYSFGHPDAPASEAPLVEALARDVAVRPRWVWPDQPDAVEDLFWRTLKAQGAPFPSASMMAQHDVCRAARDDGVKVLLGGQGGDEAFMGYRKFYLFWVQQTLRRPRFADAARLSMAAPFFLAAVAARAGVFWRERGRYGGAGLPTRLRLPPGEGGVGMTEDDTPSDRQRLDVTRYSLPTLLRYEDRNSMGASIESRLPFMDHRVIETGLALPLRLKLSHGYGKWILRDAMAGRLPDAIRLSRDKRGFDVDQAHWIERGLGRVLRSALHERRSAISEWSPAGFDVETQFSDQALSAVPSAFAEAVSLIWLGDVA